MVFCAGKCHLSGAQRIGLSRLEMAFHAVIRRKSRGEVTQIMRRSDVNHKNSGLKQRFPSAPFSRIAEIPDAIL